MRLPKASWTYEDARVLNNQSFVSFAMSDTAECGVAQSLRRFSSTPSASFERPTLSEPTIFEPMPIQPVAVQSTKEEISISSGGNNNSSNSTFDPTTYIPAQSMLTCYYSTNDDYCIGPYRRFLSLTPPPSVPLSSWYSSNVPPQLPQSYQQSSALPPDSSENCSLPLPPTIAIQGGRDAICPPDTALDLHHVWRGMELRICLEGGHSMYDTVIAGEIVKATDRFGHALIDE